jgi:hypothetical protein
MFKQSEDQLQKSVARLLDYSGLLWCHVPNGGQRNAIVGAKLKAQGVKRGVPDVLIFNEFRQEGTTFSGTALELKVEKRKPTPEQLQWHDKLREQGWFVRVCNNLGEAIRTLKDNYPIPCKGF